MITVGHTWTVAALIVVGNILGLLLLVHIAQTSTSEILSTMDYLQRGVGGVERVLVVYLIGCYFPSDFALLVVSIHLNPICSAPH